MQDSANNLHVSDSIVCESDITMEKSHYISWDVDNVVRDAGKHFCYIIQVFEMLGKIFVILIIGDTILLELF